MASLKRLRSPLLVILLGLIATIAATLIVDRMEDQRRTERFGALADAVSGSIKDQLTEHRVLLRGVAAFFQASEDVGRAEFRDYVDRLGIPQNHPGTLGIGFSLQVDDAADLRDAIERMRAEGQSGFEPWPKPFRFPASTIMLLEPQSSANRRALGFNMYGEAVRRQAMRRAMQTGQAALSGKVQLVQDGSGKASPGFLIYIPVGRTTGARPGTAAFRASGWAYSPLRAHDIVGAALDRPGLEAARLELFDGAPSEPSLLYRSADYGSPDLLTERTIDFGGRTWTVRVGSSPAQFADDPLPLAWLVAVSGGLLTLLLAALAWQQSLAASRTQIEVNRATGELRRTNRELIETSRARAEAEAHLRQSQKLEAIGQLTGGIAHDFNNMLAVILGNLDLASRRANDPERLARALSHAQKGAHRAAEMTQRLLAFGRRQPLAPRLLDPNQLVANMSELLRRTLGEQVQIQTMLAGDMWPVEADAGQLENAILNLALNARDAMPRGGTLTIETRINHLDEAYAAQQEGLKAGDYALIVVTDTGVGMSDEVMTKAFDPFFTTKEVGKGTGLGLSQVFGFVRQSGGHLKIVSEPGRGTTLKLFFPRAKGQVVATEHPFPSGVLQRGKPEELIVVAEDQDDVRSTTVASLRELGYTVAHAADGAETLDVLSRHGGATLLLTDVVMPGMNGRELSDRARSLYPDLKIVFTTGYAPDAIVHEGRLEADILMLPKPFTTAQLAACIRAAIDTPSGYRPS
jgi:signal transduction histidine kinase/ActR/RegA family two-component response regulator